MEWKQRDGRFMELWSTERISYRRHGIEEIYRDTEHSLLLKNTHNCTEQGDHDRARDHCTPGE